MKRQSGAAPLEFFLSWVFSIPFSMITGAATETAAKIVVVDVASLDLAASHAEDAASLMSVNDNVFRIPSFNLSA